MQALNPWLGLNYGLRGAAVALLLLISAVIWREARQALAGRLGAGFALSACAYALYFSPGLALPSALWHLPLALLAQGAAVLFWLMVSALFDDDFKLRIWHGLIWLAVGLLGFIQFFVLIPAGSPLRGPVGTVLDVQPVVFAALGMWQVIANWKDDLIELRRRFRGVILFATVINIVLVALTKLAASEDGQGVGVSMVEAAAVCVAAFWVLWRLQNQDLADWVVQPEPLSATVASPDIAELEPEYPRPIEQGLCQALADQTPAAPKVQAPVPPVDPSLLAALELKMTQAKIYREEDLSIGSLAQNLGVQEYQLRRLINQGLGYRNFNAFVNHYRLADAQAVLADPAKRHVAVLNIAMDCGFGSLGPFNRAFKAQTGMTPTEFRKANLLD